MENYKGFEMFSDSAYYDMIACRPIGETRFNYTQHFLTTEKAKEWIDSNIALENFHEIRSELKLSLIELNLLRIYILQLHESVGLKPDTLNDVLSAIDKKISEQGIAINLE